MKRLVIVYFGLILSGLFQAKAAVRPNVVFVYADDLGYGDTAAYGATAVKTPNIDRLAREGVRFTDAYSSASTCTPSRFSLLTGSYAFRQKNTDILPGDAALVISTNRATIASIFKNAGYSTGIVGKWHLGLGAQGQEINWNEPIKLGPNTLGFDYSFIMAATGDRVPCVYLENQKVVGLDTNDPIQVSYKHPFPGELDGVAEYDYLKIKWSNGHNNAVVNGIGRIGFMTGGKAALWKDEDRADLFTQKAVSFLEQNKSQPFFLYFAPHDIHVPRVPAARFVGATKMGPRGDVIAELDWTVGKILETLDELNLTTNTLVIFSSDNGPVLDDGYKDGAVELLGDHKPAGVFRGGKYSIFEGGTRMPLIVRWPGQVNPGVSHAVVSQVDFAASFAALTGQLLGTNDAPDSVNVLPALFNKSNANRDYIIEQGNRVLGLRSGNWKYIGPGKGPAIDRSVNIELGIAPAPQLYDVVKDPGETNNVAWENPEVVDKLSKLLNQARTSGHAR
jgi:arylsulfatase A-like enzyme